MAPVYRSTGQSSPYIVALDHGRTRNTGARFERPEGEPSIRVGVAVTALGLLAIALTVTGLSSLRDQAPSGPAAHAHQSLSQGETR